MEGYADEKRIVALAQKIRKVEEKLNRLNNQVGKIIGSSTNLGEIQSPDDAEVSSTKWTSSSIKSTIQSAMNDGYFTIQKHSHIDDSQGGDAYAKKGAALL